MIGLLTCALLLAQAEPIVLPANVPPRVCTMREMNEVLYSSSRDDVLQTTGTVQTANDGTYVIEDLTGRSFIYARRVPRAQVGDTIEVVCLKLTLGNHSKMLVASSLKVVGKGSVSPPVKRKLEELDDRRDDLLLVETEATVIDVLPDEIDARYDILLLKDGAARIPLFVPTSPENAALNGARIHVTTRYNRQANSTRLFSGPFMSSDPDTIKVIRPAADPFDVPTLNPDDYFSPQEIAAMDRRMLQGVVLATWGGNNAMIRHDNCVSRVSFARGRPLPPIGRCIVVSGYPETDLYKVNLVKADWRDLSEKPQADEQPKDVTLREITQSKDGRNEIGYGFFGHLVRLTGTLRALPNDASAERRFLLDTDGERVAVDFSACPAATDGILPGSEIEVTGRCLLEANAWRPYDVFPRITGVAILMRTPEDLRVLRTPSWWTAERLLYLVAAMGLLLLGIFIWNRILNRLADRRGRQLYQANIERAEETLRVAERTRLAVELHDSLSQYLTGVALQINAGRHTLAAQALKSCRDELRNCLWDLRSNAIDCDSMDEAIRQTLEPHVEDIALSIRFNVRRAALSDNTAYAILRIIRELVVNAIRHGGAANVRIAGSLEPDRLLFSVRDDGCGFDPANRPGIAEGHFGLQGVSERVATLGGEIAFESRPNAGTKVTVTLPCNLVTLQPCNLLP